MGSTVGARRPAIGDPVGVAEFDRPGAEHDAEVVVNECGERGDHAGIGEVPTSGTRRVSPARTTAYRITVRGADGQTATESVTVTVAVSERQALVALYEATDGPNWANNENWLTDAPLGEWFGVTTNQEGRVVSLAMSYSDGEQWINNNVSGPIPPELAYLTSLEYVQFSTTTSRVPSHPNSASSPT